MVHEILAGDGYRVSVAENGRTALDLIAGHAFDLVISDLAMPELGGQELYKELRARHPALLTRLVFITGDTLGPAARRFLARARRPVVEKPFAPDDLRRAVRAALAGPDARRPGRSPATTRR
jgi:CheY-like chemotaxis protein